MNPVDIPPPQPAALSEAKRLLRERRLRGEPVGGDKPATIPRRPAGASAPLSFAQQRLWFFHRLEPSSSLYNMPLALRLRGPLHPPALRQAIDAIVARHEILRTRFVADAGEPQQVIDAPVTLDAPVENLAASSAEGIEAQLQRRITEESERPFDLACDRILRVRLFRLGEADHVLLLVTHHIAGDGWSWGVFMHELGVMYQKFRDGTAAVVLPELALQYGDFAAWQRHRLIGPRVETLLSYWRQKLAAAPEALELPTDRPRPVVQTFNGRWETRPLGADLTQALKTLSQREGATIFMTLLAAYGVLLSRYARQTDLVIAAPVGGRSLVETEKLIGFFVNTLALRLDLSGDPTFRELIGRVRTLALEAFTHADMPFEKLVEELHPRRQPNRLPLAQVAFVLQNTLPVQPRLAGIEVTQVPSWTRTAKFELTLCVDETADGLVSALEYNTDLFASTTARQMLESLQVVLEAAARDPDRHIGDLPLLSRAARQQLLVDWNNTARPYPRDATVTELVERQVERSPAAPAVIHVARQLTYHELNVHANQLAHRLRRLGIGPNKLVALCLERSPELIVGVLAILKAGGAYVSLDPSYPPERLAFMLADSQASVVLTVQALEKVLSGSAGSLPAVASGEGWVPPASFSEAGGTPALPKIIRLDMDWADIAREAQANPPPVTRAEDLAYVSYTSGSTGRPKGVCIPHRAVNRLLINTDFIQLGPEDRVLQISNCAFDASTFEIWGALLHGARLIIVPQETVLAPHEFAREIAARGVTAMFLTTALFNQLAHHAPGIFREVRHVLFGGEACSPQCVSSVLRQDPPARLLHVYGPTETTTFATWFEVREVPEGAVTIPIGRPVANTTLYVLDERQQPAPIGVPGELYIGGDGVARGYWNQPTLTAERFVTLRGVGHVCHPLDDKTDRHLMDDNRAGERVYRTGDRVRWLADGTIEFLGRFDRQVKLRGFRIELEEIETALAAHPAVKESVVVPGETVDGDRRLVAYVGTGVPQPTGGELREHLRRLLPEYMVPSAFALMEALPLNANGKVDRGALPRPEERDAAVSSKSTPPRDEIETRIAAIWERVLDIRGVGIHDNFFELGGHSLAGVRLFAELEQAFGRKLPLASLFAGPTVAELARRLREDRPTRAAGSLVVLQGRGARTPLFFLHGAGVGNLWMYANLVPHLAADQPVYAFESRPAPGVEFIPFEEMAAQYIAEMRRVQPHGPYLLSGYCFGGNVAYEMACQLRAAGEQVALLALLDSAAPCGSYYRLPWWRPEFAIRFAANTGYWLYDFFGQPPAVRRNLVRRKLRIFARLLRSRFRGAAGDASEIDLESVIDTSQYPAEELKIWQAHVRAAWAHRPKRYPGRVTLFRTRRQPFLCSLDPQYGWGEFAEGGVDVVLTPGAHEQIFLEPHVRALATRLQACIAAADLPERREEHLPIPGD